MSADPAFLLPDPIAISLVLALMLHRASRADPALEALRRLLSTLSDDVDLVTEGDVLPPFDLHCPFVRVPFAFDTTIETIPGDVPCLHPAPGLVAMWQARLRSLSGLKMGLVWAGDTGLAVPEAAARDRRRSIPLTRLAPLGQIPGISFIPSQKRMAARQAVRLPSSMMVMTGAGS